MGRKYTREDCLEAIEEAYDIIGESPTIRQYRSLDISPSSNVIREVVGGFNQAKDEVGIETYGYSHNSPGGSSIDPKPNDVTIPEDKDWENMSSRMRWYYKNKEHALESEKERVDGRVEWLRSLKESEFECITCGEGHPAVLDFHHIDPEEKELSISKMASSGYSKERILEAMKDCECLCSNCHRKKHWNERLK